MSSPSSIVASCSSRTKRLVNSARIRAKKDINPSPLQLFPVIKYETSSLFTSNIESKDQKGIYLDRLKKFYDIDDFLRENFLESPVDDSDLDKDYEPSDSSSSSSECDDDVVESKSIKRVKISHFEENKSVSEQKSEAKRDNEKSDIRNEGDGQNETEVSNFTNKVPEIDGLVKNTVQENLNNEEGIEEQSTGELRRNERIPVGVEKINRDKNMHPMRAICGGKCRKLCKSLTEEHRHDIWNKYWNLDYTCRREWLSKHLTLVPVKRRSTSAEHPRSESRHFTLPLADYTEIAVCRLTFLNTLGYSSDSVITELVHAMKAGPCGDQVKERRGGSHRPEVDRDVIKNHIESFKPCVSHYRRKNAPNVRYLPRDLTIKIMYDEFVLKHPNVCKVEVYRQVMKKMNISLRQPKLDACEECLSLRIILENEDSENIQSKFDVHRAKAAKANLEYKKTQMKQQMPVQQINAFTLWIYKK